MSVDTAIRALHLIGAAVWAGGLVFLVLAVGVAQQVVTNPRQRIELFRKLGRRFLVVGGLALLVQIATGSTMASDRLGSWSALFDSDYGRRLTEKLALVVTLILLMLFHSFVQGPGLSRLREQALERPDDAELAALVRRKSARSGVINALMALLTLGILVLAARLVAP